MKVSSYLKFWPRPHFSARQLLLGGIALLTLGLITDLQGLPSWGSRNNSTCAQIMQTKATLSREQLEQFLAMSEGVPQSQLLTVIKDPYCKLAGIKTTAGTIVDRHVYPLAFDPQTWVVVKYEGQRYIGYEFKVR
jgi:hypothetical protein